MSRITRRQFLKVGAAGAVGLGGLTWSRCAHRRAGSRIERPIELIEHVVVIYQENWSFDSLFGRFPGANGIANAGDTIKQVDKDGTPYSLLPPAMDNRKSPAVADARIPANLPVAPFDLVRYVAPDQFCGNPLHRYYQHIAQINGGKLDKFVAMSTVGALAMSYYDATNLPLGGYAQQYVLCDNFFQAALGGSTLNHIWLVAAATPVWPDAPQAVRVELRRRLAVALREQLLAVCRAHRGAGPYSPDAVSAGRRAVKNSALGLLMELDDAGMRALCMKQFEAADNMTDALAALSLLANCDCPERAQALDAFYNKWKNEPLVVDKWLAVQSTTRLPSALVDVKRLMAHPAFNIRNPNKVYALIGGFRGNQVRFHAADGSGYAFLADFVLD